MAVRYAHDNAASAGHVKRQVIVALLMACRNMPKSHTPDWSSLNQYAPEWSEVEAACQLSEPGEVVPHAVSSPKDHSPSPEDIDSKQSSSSSSSDTDTDGEQLQEVTDSWFRHLAHLVQGSKNGRFIPWCRDLAFDAPHAERGQGLEEAETICKKCMARAPLASRQALRRLCDGDLP